MSQIKKELMLSGDKVVMLEKNGQFYFENSAMPAFSRAEEAFEGESEKAGLFKRYLSRVDDHIVPHKHVLTGRKEHCLPGAVDKRILFN